MSYTYADAWRQAAIGWARAPEESQIATIINKAQALIWRGYDWRWTTADLDPFWLEPYIQDYNFPMVVVPDNFERLLKAYVIKLTSPKSITEPLEIRQELNVENFGGIPKQISFIRQTRTLRFWPCPTGSIGAPNYMINATYKTLPTRVTLTTYQATNIPSQDQQIGMWVNALKWAYADAIGDPKAGDAQIVAGRPPMYTGLLAKAQAEIYENARIEQLDQGPPQVAPDQSLATPRWPGSWWW